MIFRRQCDARLAEIVTSRFSFSDVSLDSLTLPACTVQFVCIVCVCVVLRTCNSSLVLVCEINLIMNRRARHLGRFKLHVASRYLFHASAHHLRYPSWTPSATPPSASRFRLYRRARLYVDELAMTRRIKTGGHTPVRHRHQQGQASFHVILVGGYVCDEWNACLRLPQQLARTSLLPTPND